MVQLGARNGVISIALTPKVDRGRLRLLLEVIDVVEDLVTQRQLSGLVIGKHALYLRVEVIPLLGSPELIHHQEAAVQQVPPQRHSFRVGKDDRPRGNNEDKRMIEQFWISQVKNDRVRIHFERSKFLKAVGYVPVGFGKVAVPTSKVMRRVTDSGKRKKRRF